MKLARAVTINRKDWTRKQSSCGKPQERENKIQLMISAAEVNLLTKEQH